MNNEDGTVVWERPGLFRSFRCAGNGVYLYLRRPTPICIAAILTMAGAWLLLSDDLIKCALTISATTLMSAEMMYIATAALDRKIPSAQVTLSGVIKKALTWRGWKESLRERNMRLHNIAAPSVIIAGLVIGLDLRQWGLLLLLIGEIMGGESANTVIEELADKNYGYLDPDIGSIKDLFAGAVLLSALAAVYFAHQVYLPKMISLVMALF